MTTQLHDLTAGYALDALDADERRAFEAHLESCETCRAELATLAPVAGALAVAAGSATPSPELRERILEQARTEPQVLVPLRRRSRLLPALSGVAAVAAAVALGIGLWAHELSQRLDDTRSTLEVLADPDSRAIDLAMGEGRLVVDRAGNAVLVAAGLDRAPAGKTYETWVVQDGTPVSAGLFAGGSEVTVVDVEAVVPAGSLVAVTLEDAGGVDAPSTPPVVASKPV